jgi:hypothetical protein
MARTCSSLYSLLSDRLRAIPDTAQLSRVLDRNDIATMRQYLQAGIVDVDMRVPMHTNKVPLLFCAWEHGHTAMVELLLDYGASVAQFVLCNQRRYHFWALRTPVAHQMMACVRQLRARGAVEVGASDKLEWFEQTFGRSIRGFEDRATGYELNWFGRDVPSDIDAFVQRLGRMPDSVARSGRGTSYT